MLNNLMKRLNKDANLDIDRQLLSECGIIASNTSEIDKAALTGNTEKDIDISDLREKLSNVELCDTDNFECNSEKIYNAAKATDPLNESIISTNKRIEMTKDDYKNLIIVINDLKGDDPDKIKSAVKKTKSFLREVSRQLRKCNDDNPADALIISCINKLCNIYDIDIEFDDDATKKYKLTVKINALAKVIR